MDRVLLVFFNTFTLCRQIKISVTTIRKLLLDHLSSVTSEVKSDVTKGNRVLTLSIRPNLSYLLNRRKIVL